MRVLTGPHVHPIISASTLVTMAFGVVLILNITIIQLLNCP